MKLPGCWAAPNGLVLGLFLNFALALSLGALTRAQSSPTLSAISPTYGAPGTVVTITGTNFGTTQGSSTVYIQSESTRLNTTLTPTSWSNTQIVAPIPSGTANGANWVNVTVGGGAASGTVVFTVGNPPLISGTTPSYGPPGTAVTITGTNFGSTQGSSTVYMTDMATRAVTQLTPTSWSNTQVVTSIPSGTAVGAYWVNMTVAGLTGINVIDFTVGSPPLISGTTPSYGPPGTAVTITGTNFGSTQGSSTVYMTDMATRAVTQLTPTSWSNTQVVTSIPSGTAVGAYWVNMTVAGLTGINVIDFTVGSPPLISGTTPSYGPPGTAVTITGTNFGSTQGSSTVYMTDMATRAVTQLTPTSWSNTQVVTSIPSGTAVGAYWVNMTVAGLTGINVIDFTVGSPPLISGTTPSYGPPGTAVTITGTNFGSTQGSSTVYMTDMATRAVTQLTPTSWSNTQVVTSIPSGTAVGAYWVNMTVAGLTGINVIDFTVGNPPLISGTTPSYGPPGTAVTITGTNFGSTQGSSTVYMTDMATRAVTQLTPTSWSNTQVVTSIPSGTAVGAYWVNMTVAGLTGINVIDFTVGNPPLISGTTPSYGPPGTAVTITGTNFGSTQGSSTVYMTDMATRAVTQLTPTSWSNTQVVTSIPSGTAVGAYWVNMTVAGLTGINVIDFTVGNPPLISGTTPSYGPPGTAVTITGTNFGSTQGSSTVYMTDMATRAVTQLTPTSWSNTQVVTSIPSGTAVGAYWVNMTVAGLTGINVIDFTVGSPPLISGTTPSYGPPGTAVTITGTNFGSTQGSSTVFLQSVIGHNITQLTPTSWSNTQVVTSIPSGTALGVYWVNMTVAGLTGINVIDFTVGNPAPVISSLSPHSGATGTAVTISGNYFGTSQLTSTVTFNGTAATPTSWSETSILVPVPAGATSGNVLVTVGGISSNTLVFTVGTGPAISSLSPTTGSAGTAVAISGSNFGSTQGTSTIKFNGVTATPTSWTSSTIVAPVPSGATSGNVVATVGGVSSNGVYFAVGGGPNISSIAPTAGPPGTLVTITGTNFGSTQGTSTVSLNGAAATAISWNSASIVVPVPAGATSGNFVVTVNGVASNGINFTVRLTPSITMLSPSYGPAGTLVTISGTNFGATQSSGTVTLNGVAMAVTSWTSTSIVTSVPSGATTGNVVVTVGGLTSNGFAFVVATPPHLASLSPTSGNVGTSVTVAGTNFGSTQGTSTVSFNGVPATPSSWSATGIVATVPTGTTTGPVVVTVAGLSSNGLIFAVGSGPGITNINPSSGKIGTLVTINGVNFGSTEGASAIAFNGVTATATSWNATTIVTTVPSGSSSGNIVVTVNGIASNPFYFAIPPPAPVLTGLSPNSGAVGSIVTISGTNLGSSGVVTLNGTRATTTAWSPSSISAVVPSGATTGNVLVTSNGFTSNGLTFVVGISATAPAIYNVNPCAGAVGASMTITGANFGAAQGTSTVTFNGVSAGKTSSWSAGSIGVTVPTGASSGFVVVNVSSSSSNPYPFTISGGPTICSLSPTAGPVGTPVVITGANFGAAGTVTFGGTQGVPTTWTSTSIVVPVPAGMPAGSVNVVVTAGAATSNAVPFAVTPSITALSHSEGPIQMGIIITGTSFGPAPANCAPGQACPAVAIGGVPMTLVMWSAPPWWGCASSCITVQIPQAAATGNVVVTVGGEQSNGVQFTVDPAFCDPGGGLPCN